MFVCLFLTKKRNHHPSLPIDFSAMFIPTSIILSFRRRYWEWYIDHVDRCTLCSEELNSSIIAVWQSSCHRNQWKSMVVRRWEMWEQHFSQALSQCSVRKSKWDETIVDYYRLVSSIGTDHSENFFFSKAWQHPSESFEERSNATVTRKAWYSCQSQWKIPCSSMKTIGDDCAQWEKRIVTK